MHPDVHLVIQVQELDQKIAALEAEVAQLPRHIASIEKALDSHLRKLEADKAALAANQRDRKKHEGDIQMAQQKISKLRDQMLGAKTNEQYRAFQNEIEYAENEIRKAEDQILELMTQSEPLDAAVKAAEAALKQEQQQVNAEKKVAEERTAADKQQLAAAAASRAETLGKLPRNVVLSYERIRKKWRGTVVAEVLEGRCTACQMLLRPQFYQDLRRGGELMYCESCGRLLFYNPPVSFENAV